MKWKGVAQAYRESFDRLFGIKFKMKRQTEKNIRSEVDKIAADLDRELNNFRVVHPKEKDHD
jgi:hypothetical protein